MGWDSILDDRLADWVGACDAWGFAIHPQISASLVEAFPVGYLELHASRPAAIDGETIDVTLTVVETWSTSPHRHDGRLDRHGGSVTSLKWHVQVGPDVVEGDHGERLEVVEPDPWHARIHRHPYGQPNPVKHEADFWHPDQFLSALNKALGGAFET